MPINIPRIIIIDDNREHGIKVAGAIWNSGYPVRYLEYPSDVSKIGANKFLGVRVIFMDIDLIGDGAIGDEKKVFSSVQSVIESCLDKNNGPYILITWTMHDKYSEALINYLGERLPAGLRPGFWKRLDKEEFMAEGREVDLSERITGYLSDMGPTGCLINWEKFINNACCETMQALIDLSSETESLENKEALTRLLFDLAVAEGGRHLTDANITSHLYSMLSSLLTDKLLKHPLATEDACGRIIKSGVDVRINGEWKSKINTMLHIDQRPSANPAIHAPGDVFNYPEGEHGFPVPKVDGKKFLRGNFMFFIDESEKNARKAEIEEKCRLVLIEITPSCDFAQDKHVWNRYVIGGIIPAALIDLAYIIDRSDPDKPARLEGKIPDYCWLTPQFNVESLGDFFIVISSRLIVSLEKKGPAPGALERKFRIKQPLLGDMTGWLARQISRIGHVSV